MHSSGSSLEKRSSVESVVLPCPVITSCEPSREIEYSVIFTQKSSRLSAAIERIYRQARLIEIEKARIFESPEGKRERTQCGGIVQKGGSDNNGELYVRLVRLGFAYDRLSESQSDTFES
jgi:hypothetical protein